MQLKVRKRLVYGTIVVEWIVIPAFLTVAGSFSTDIVHGFCIPWSIYHGQVEEKVVTTFMFLVTYLLPVILMVFCYSRIVYRLKNKVTDMLCYDRRHK